MEIASLEKGLGLKQLIKNCERNLSALLYIRAELEVGQPVNVQIEGFTINNFDCHTYPNLTAVLLASVITLEGYFKSLKADTELELKELV